jgi:hypothetical protein
MKKSIILSFIIIMSNFYQISAQNEPLKEIFFPYKSGYEFNMTDTTIEYDQYNFPKGQTLRETRYAVSDAEKKGVLIFKLNVYDMATNELAASVESFLTWGKKGMSWWVEKDKNAKEKGIPTNAIKLPMSKGSKWKSSFQDQEATMTCIATDTILPTIYGNISCFGVSYEIIIKDDKEYKYYTVVKEYYNAYAGKVHTEDETYILMKAGGKLFMLTKSWGNITYSNLTEDQKLLIK